MKKIRKILLGFIAIFFAAVVCIFCYYRFILPSFEQEPEQDSYDQDIELVMNTVPTEILVYGEKINFRDSVKYTLVDKIDENIFDTEKKRIYLIINDLDDNSGITKDDLTLLKNLLDQNNKANLIYLGSKQLDTLQSLGYYDLIAMDDARSVTYSIYGGDRIDGWGLWTTEEDEITKKNPELLGELIMLECAGDIKSNQ